MSERNELFVLPFDHRGSFMEEMFGVSANPTEADVASVKYYKEIIYSGFKIAMLRGKVPRENAAILVDEEFGDSILIDAKKNGFKICVCSEKSGQKEFELEYGDDFKQHIRKYSPDYVKALIRYNPDEDREMNLRQLEKLRVLYDFCREENFKLMLEPLVPATKMQMDIVDGDIEAYDQEMRPKLMELMIEELQEGGIEPDIWKIEGLDESENYRMLVQQIKAGKMNSNIIVLGRHADAPVVERWLRAGKNIEGVIGFAIGRTIFWDPLVEYKDGKIDAETAMEKIAAGFEHFYRVYEGE